MIGSPPGYIGYEEGGQLTELVRRRPYSVILFDEIEKANKEVFNVLLQILDDGQLTDAKGRKVNFKNAVIIMTSNLGSEIIRDHSQKTDLGFEGKEKNTRQELEKEIQKSLKETFKPEFLNRVDEIIIFESLKKKQVKEIANLQLKEVKKRLKDKKIKLNISEKAKTLIAEMGFDPLYGARPLKRVIQREILNPLSLKIIKGEVKTKKTFKVDVKNKSIVIA
jgi:ATP-dependent Clp protease ATP-binding subunit ClpB